MKKFLLLFIWASFHLHGSLHDAAVQLMSCIPSELQHLPYASYPSSEDYNTVRLITNKRFVYFPKAIISPRSCYEAQYIVSIFKKYHLKFAIRSGGHCFEPGSLSSDYVLDLKNFNSILPNVGREEVYLGAGCRLGDVIELLGRLDYAIPTGTCPTVAVGGLTLGGGIGLLSRPYGLTCDSVKSITMINADAQIIEVDKASYPDLFWALLGAGNGSYGVVLGFTFHMHYIPDSSFYELIWEWDPKLVYPIMHAWQQWIESLPSNISSVLGIRHPSVLCAVPENSPPLSIRIFGLKIGPKDFTEWKSAFKHLHPEVKIYQGSYLENSKYWVSQADNPFSKNKSKILMRPLSKRVINLVVDFFDDLEARNPNYLVYFNFESFGGRIPEFRTAFFPRDAFAWWYQAYYWDYQNESEEVLELSRAFYESIPNEVSDFCYANIVDYDLQGRYLDLYYGDHVHQLIKIKKKYDRSNLFNWRQSIPTKRPK